MNTDTEENIYYDLACSMFKKQFKQGVTDLLEHQNKMLIEAKILNQYDDNDLGNLLISIHQLMEMVTATAQQGIGLSLLYTQGKLLDGEKIKGLESKCKNLEEENKILKSRLKPGLNRFLADMRNVFSEKSKSRI